MGSLSNSDTLIMILFVISDFQENRNRIPECIKTLGVKHDFLYFEWKMVEIQFMHIHMSLNNSNFFAFVFLFFFSSSQFDLRIRSFFYLFISNTFKRKKNIISSSVYLRLTRSCSERSLPSWNESEFRQRRIIWNISSYAFMHYYLLLLLRLFIRCHSLQIVINTFLWLLISSILFSFRAFDSTLFFYCQFQSKQHRTFLSGILQSNDERKIWFVSSYQEER